MTDKRSLTGEHCSSARGAHCSWVSTLHSCLVTISFLRVFYHADKVEQRKDSPYLANLLRLIFALLSLNLIAHLLLHILTPAIRSLCNCAILPSDHMCNASPFTSSYTWYGTLSGTEGLISDSTFVVSSVWYLLVHNGGLVLRLALLLNDGVASSWASI